MKVFNKLLHAKQKWLLLAAIVVATSVVAATTLLTAPPKEADVAEALRKQKAKIELTKTTTVSARDASDASASSATQGVQGAQGVTLKSWAKGTTHPDTVVAIPNSAIKSGTLTVDTANGYTGSGDSAGFIYIHAEPETVTGSHGNYNFKFYTSDGNGIGLNDTVTFFKDTLTWNHRLKFEGEYASGRPTDSVGFTLGYGLKVAIDTAATTRGDNISGYTVTPADSGHYKVTVTNSLNDRTLDTVAHNYVYKYTVGLYKTPSTTAITPAAGDTTITGLDSTARISESSLTFDLGINVDTTRYDSIQVKVSAVRISPFVTLVDSTNGKGGFHLTDSVLKFNTNDTTYTVTGQADAAGTLTFKGAGKQAASDATKATMSGTSQSSTDSVYQFKITQDTTIYVFYEAPNKVTLDTASVSDRGFTLSSDTAQYGSGASQDSVAFLVTRTSTTTKPGTWQLINAAGTAVDTITSAFQDLGSYTIRVGEKADSDTNDTIQVKGLATAAKDTVIKVKYIPTYDTAVARLVTNNSYIKSLTPADSSGNVVDGKFWFTAQLGAAADTIRGGTYALFSTANAANADSIKAPITYETVYGTSVDTIKITAGISSDTAFYVKYNPPAIWKVKTSTVTTTPLIKSVKADTFQLQSDDKYVIEVTLGSAVDTLRNGKYLLYGKATALTDDSIKATGGAIGYTVKYGLTASDKDSITVTGINADTTLFVKYVIPHKVTTGKVTTDSYVKNVTADTTVNTGETLVIKAYLGAADTLRNGTYLLYGKADALTADSIYATGGEIGYTVVTGQDYDSIKVTGITADTTLFVKYVQPEQPDVYTVGVTSGEFVWEVKDTAETVTAGDTYTFSTVLLADTVKNGTYSLVFGTEIGDTVVVGTTYQTGINATVIYGNNSSGFDTISVTGISADTTFKVDYEEPGEEPGTAVDSTIVTVQAHESQISGLTFTRVVAGDTVELKLLEDGISRGDTVKKGDALTFNVHVDTAALNIGKGGTFEITYKYHSNAPADEALPDTAVLVATGNFDSYSEDTVYFKAVSADVDPDTVYTITVKGFKGDNYSDTTNLIVKYLAAEVVDEPETPETPTDSVNVQVNGTPGRVNVTTNHTAATTEDDTITAKIAKDENFKFHVAKDNSLSNVQGKYVFDPAESYTVDADDSVSVSTASDVTVSVDFEAYPYVKIIANGGVGVTDNEGNTVTDGLYTDDGNLTFKVGKPTNTIEGYVISVTGGSPQTSQSNDSTIVTYTGLTADTTTVTVDYVVGATYSLSLTKGANVTKLTSDQAGTETITTLPVIQATGTATFYATLDTTAGYQLNVVFNPVSAGTATATRVATSGATGVWKIELTDVAADAAVNVTYTAARTAGIQTGDNLNRVSSPVTVVNEQVQFSVRLKTNAGLSTQGTFSVTNAGGNVELIGRNVNDPTATLYATASEIVDSTATITIYGVNTGSYNFVVNYKVNPAVTVNAQTSGITIQSGKLQGVAEDDGSYTFGVTLNTTLANLKNGQFTVTGANYTLSGSGSSYSVKVTGITTATTVNVQYTQQTLSSWTAEATETVNGLITFSPANGSNVTDGTFEFVTTIGEELELGGAFTYVLYTLGTDGTTKTIVNGASATGKLSANGENDTVTVNLPTGNRAVTSNVHVLVGYLGEPIKVTPPTTKPEYTPVLPENIEQASSKPSAIVTPVQDREIIVPGGTVEDAKVHTVLTGAVTGEPATLRITFEGPLATFLPYIDLPNVLIKTTVIRIVYIFDSSARSAIGTRSVQLRDALSESWTEFDPETGTLYVHLAGIDVDAVGPDDNNVALYLITDGEDAEPILITDPATLKAIAVAEHPILLEPDNGVPSVGNSGYFVLNGTYPTDGRLVYRLANDVDFKSYYGELTNSEIDRLAQGETLYFAIRGLESATGGLYIYLPKTYSGDSAGDTPSSNNPIVRRVDVQAATGAALNFSTEGGFTVNEEFNFVVTPEQPLPNGELVLQFFKDGIEIPTAPVVEGDKTPNADGSFNVSIKRIKTSGLLIIVDYRTSTGNTSVQTAKAWTNQGKLYISSANNGIAKVYSINGSLVKTVTLQAGNTSVTDLPNGNYIVALPTGKTEKVNAR